MTVAGLQVDVPRLDAGRYGNVKHGKLSRCRRPGGTTAIIEIEAILLFRPAIVKVRIPVEQPFANSGFGLPAQRLGPGLVERLLHLGTQLQGCLVFHVLELDALVEIDVAVLREGRVVVVVPCIVVLVDDRGVEPRRSRRAVEGILAVIAPRTGAVDVDRECPSLCKGFVIGQPDISVIIVVVRHIEKVAGNGIRCRRKEGL